MIAAYRDLIERSSDPIERSCSSKTPFTTRREATQRLRHGRSQDGTLRPYHCGHCGEWHLGHRPRRRLRH